MTKEKDERRGAFLQAAALLPRRLREPLEGLDGAIQADAEEVRLRAGWAMTVLLPDGERNVPGAEEALLPGDLSLVLEVATHASAHTALSRVCQGFFTLEGGHRMGLCGSTVVENGEVRNLRQLSSLALRVARQRRGVCAPVLPALRQGGGLHSTLILSPPGGGKTTLLRDLIRACSSGEGGAPLRMAVADERGEVAALWEGIPQLDVGPCTDVLEGCPKAEGLMMLLRGMNPQVLCADEITAPADLAALETAANCGVSLLATAHGSSLDDLRRRPLYRDLLARGIFRRLVTISGRGTAREYAVTDLEGTSC